MNEEPNENTEEVYPVALQSRFRRAFNWVNEKIIKPGKLVVGFLFRVIRWIIGLALRILFTIILIGIIVFLLDLWLIDSWGIWENTPPEIKKGLLQIRDGSWMTLQGVLVIVLTIAKWIGGFLWDMVAGFF